MKLIHWYEPRNFVDGSFRDSYEACSSITRSPKESNGSKSWESLPLGSSAKLDNAGHFTTKPQDDLLAPTRTKRIRQMWGDEGHVHIASVINVDRLGGSLVPRNRTSARWLK